MQELTPKQNNGEVGLIERLSSVDDRISKLLGVLETFERWNEAMTDLLDHNSEMSGRNKALSKIVQELTLLAVNARIEAAHAAESGKGFAVVANRVGLLATDAEELSKSFTGSLNKNTVLTTTTFQDIQASSRMIITMLRALERDVKELTSKSD